MNAEISSTAIRVRVRGFSRSLPMALLHAREAVMAGYQPILRAADLSEQQWRVLYVLGFENEIDATLLADTTNLLPPSLSRILRDLSSRGLIDRRLAPDDRRKTLISVSEAGRELIASIAPDIEAAHAALVERFGHERLDKLQRLLRLLDGSAVPERK